MKLVSLENIKIAFPNLVRSVDNIYVGKSGGINNIIAVVFDPNIEVALDIRDNKILRIIKTRNACEKMQPILRTRRDLIVKVTSDILSILP